MINKSRGIVYLAFGKEFDKLTAATAAYSRKFTKLPICILTNLKEQNVAWKSVSDVCFKFIPLPSEENRKIKVSAIDYTPYDETLFMGADAVIQKHGIESLFDYLKDFDLVCQYYGLLQKNCRYIRVPYGKLAERLGESYPIDLFSEAALLFRKTKASQEFFILWKKYWELFVSMGSGRDMPGFCFAVKHSKANIKVFRKEVQFCTNRENNAFFIQHKGFRNFEKKFGLPSYVDWNPKL